MFTPSQERVYQTARWKLRKNLFRIERALNDKMTHVKINSGNILSGVDEKAG